MCCFFPKTKKERKKEKREEEENTHAYSLRCQKCNEKKMDKTDATKRRRKKKKKKKKKTKKNSAAAATTEPRGRRRPLLNPTTFKSDPGRFYDQTAFLRCFYKRRSLLEEKKSGGVI